MDEFIKAYDLIFAAIVIVLFMLHERRLIALETKLEALRKKLDDLQG